MAKDTRQIGSITKAGPLYLARPTGQPGQMFKTSGEARSFFRRYAGQEAPVQAGQLPVQASSVSFEGDLEGERLETVFLTANFGPLPLQLRWTRERETTIMSVFEAGKGTSTGEIVEKSFPLENTTVRVRVKPQEVGFADVFEEVPVWLSYDQREEGAQAGWIGKDFEEYLDDEGKPQVRILGNIFLLNAARLESQIGIARMIQILVSYGAPFDEAKRVVAVAAVAVGIQEAEEEVFRSTFLAAAEDVQNAAESSKQKALVAARASLALNAAPAAPVADEPS